MSAILIVAIALIALAYALRPLVATPRTLPDTQVADAEVRKRRALEALLDLEADLAAGKLAAEDYEVFKETYERDALAALRELDVAAQTSGEDALEAEIAAARASLR